MEIPYISFSNDWIHPSNAREIDFLDLKYFIKN